METLSLDGRTVLITGASSGIGTASAHALAGEGVDLALAARREDRLDEIADAVESEHDVETLTISADVRDEESVESMVEGTVERFGGLDILLNNAGLGRGGDVESLSTEDYRLMQDTNVDGMFFTTRAALPHLKESQGNLIFIGSFAGHFPRPSNPVYAATKWWTRGFASSVQASVGEEGVAVTVINPSEVRTEFGSASGESFAERFQEGEVTEPEEVADAVVFAAGQQNSTVSELDLYRRNKFSGF
ncbi:SDR family oxidoreductase [Halalkalicoccus jeotgali]|uniref:Oxidoreductase n=1 Tax=Halalkalicoccus jeotgali (strain DSM 18796 / CECT 7217 / JCM 14584 / KCTC 4019 / B3) TaxID=795797 RepID=D8J2G9_HALJB|nr:SDR family oxidoreductase [Halalkalicoccus jeotgali]ADJ14926.1 oxidoreductase [Halalkalicoccus jeotgali B3]ELY35058.1 oxidoreductase [Halalkalicoccus jeotgali B3]